MFPEGRFVRIITIQVRMKWAFVLGFMEVTLWVTVVSAIVKYIETAPSLAVFFTDSVLRPVL